MKRQSRKKRRLEYIRYKNKLRRFNCIEIVLKTSSLYQHLAFRKIEQMAYDKVKYIKDYYYIELDDIKYSLGVTAEDILNDTITIKAKVKRLRHDEK